MDQGAIGECNPYCQEIGSAKWTIERKAVYICGCPIWDLPFVSARYDIMAYGLADYTVRGGSPDGTCKVRSHLVELEKSFQEWCNT